MALDITKLNPKVQTLLKEAETKSAAFRTMMAAGNDMNTEETGRAAELSAELKLLKGTVKSLLEGEENGEWFKTLLTTPDSPFVMGGKPDADSVAEVKDGKLRGIKGIDDKVLAMTATKSYHDSWMEYLGKGIHGMNEGARKALTEGADSSGGFLVPSQVQQMLVQKTPTPTRLANRVRKWTTGRDQLTFPTNIWGGDDIYTSPIRMTKTGEVPASASTAQQSDPTFGQARIQIFTYMVNGQISRDMMEDALFDMQSFLVDKYSEAADIIKDLKILLGTGVGETTGILANPGSTVGGHQQPATVNLGSPMTGDGVMNLAYAVPEQYDDNSVFVMNKVNGLRTIATLKDGNSRYLFSGQNYGDTGIATARPKEIAGYPYVLSGLAPDPGANNFPLIFGDLTGYYLVERVGLAIQVLDQTKATLNQIELVGRLRFGGQTVEDWKLKVGKNA